MRRSVQNNQIKTALKKLIKKLEQTNDKSESKKSGSLDSAAKTNYKRKKFIER